MFITSLRKPEAFTDALANSGARIVNLSGGKYNPFKLLSLVKLIRNEHVDVVHTHLTASRFLGVIAGFFGGAKRIFSHDHSGDEYLRKRKWTAKLVLYPLDRMLMSCTDQVLAVSEAIVAFNVDCKKIPKQKVTICHNWIDVGRFSPDLNDRRELRLIWQIPESAFVVGAVGRLSSQKGYRYLVEAAAEVVAVEAAAAAVHQSLRNLAAAVEAVAAVAFLAAATAVHQSLRTLVAAEVLFVAA